MRGQEVKKTLKKIISSLGGGGRGGEGERKINKRERGKGSYILLVNLLYRKLVFHKVHFL